MSGRFRITNQILCKENRNKNIANCARFFNFFFLFVNQNYEVDWNIVNTGKKTKRKSSMNTKR